jgi:monofunctional biosynthetic peptidoglycan transglycosylase
MAPPRPSQPGALHALILYTLVGALLYAGYEAWSWPAVAPLARRPPATTAFIERSRAQQRAEGRPARVAWTWVDYARISPHLKRAVVIAEDIKFFSHRGFDTAEIGQALREALEAGERPRGASTITQQLAKNLWLSPSLNPLRKVKEAVLTWQLERALSKRRILELYLNVVEFGPGLHGAEAASRRYFGKAAAELSEDEAVELAATLPKPSSWRPGATSRAYRRYVDIIKRRMATAAFLWRQI